MSSKPLSVISLFSGGGGLDLGLESTGFQVRFASDVDHHSCVTLRNGKLNSKMAGQAFMRHCEVVQEDVCKLKTHDVLEAAKLSVGECDLLAGGPPCQAFSVFGKRRGREDPRGRLVFEYLRILSEVRPKAFLFENVFGMLTVENGQVFREVVERLSAPTRGLRYKISVQRANACSFGVPQFRDRVFLIGTRIGTGVENLAEVTGDQSQLSHEGKPLLPWRTVRDAFRGLPPMGASDLANHVGRNHSERIIDRYSKLSPRERDHHTRINRLDLDRPSFTIIVGSDKGGGKGHVHPTDPREVTPRESARIQTFPDWWEFSGTSRHPIRQIGNAVPPLMGACVGNAIRKQVFGRRPTPFKRVVERLGQEHLFVS